ncbi:MAG TPA: hypothetical protein VFF11_09765, partial [Candidatus Binatia bacterium]|nr:hypothetical protein [Candidatus Binatia bacterium]
LSERSDALCIVVSEERGTMSIARRGNIWPVEDSAELAEVLAEFYDEVSPRRQQRPWVVFFQKNYREKAVALGLSVALWIVMVFRAHMIEQTFDVTVNYSLLPGNLTVSRIDPPKVKVTLSGQRKNFDFVNADKVKLTLELWDVQMGRQPVSITSDDLDFPSDLELQDIEPRGVVLEIVQKPSEPVPHDAGTNTRDTANNHE